MFQYILASQGYNVRLFLLNAAAFQRVFHCCLKCCPTMSWAQGQSNIIHKFQFSSFVPWFRSYSALHYPTSFEPNQKKEKVIIFSAANTQFRAKEQNKYVVMKSFQENNLWNTLQSDCLLVICKFAGHASMLFHISVSPSLVLIHLYKFIQTFPPMLIVLTGLFSYLYCVDVFLIMFRIMFRNIIKLRNAHYYYYYLLLLYSFIEVECGGFYEKSFVIARSLSISPWNFLYSTMVSVPIVQNRQLHAWFMNILFSLFLYHMSIESTSAKNYRYISLHN